MLTVGVEELPRCKLNYRGSQQYLTYGKIVTPQRFRFRVIPAVIACVFGAVAVGFGVMGLYNEMARALSGDRLSQVVISAFHPTGYFALGSFWIAGAVQCWRGKFIQAVLLGVAGPIIGTAIFFTPHVLR